MSLIPLGNRVLIDPDKEEEQTKSGIVLVRERKEKPTKGTVVAVADHYQGVVSGVAATLLPDYVSPLKAGDRIVFQRYAGVEVEETLPDTEFTGGSTRTLIVLDVKDILAVER